ncbi:response regulator transcription factor [Sandaracinus amylolyticus]|uniref:Dna binding response regulator PrrA n=1 Tax=Sandaracinus amylolyticus TaxID=927083 RepID=A0A0F6YN74_9BACT|nr:response regulator [Sandaracinus amylolyticus]AKF10097.1 Dna binding response regulator PrrA [Sandaracinus amylolyticus]
MTNAREHAPSILVVDDDDVFRERLARALAQRGLAVRTARDADEAATLANAESPELALVDLRMPGPSGLALIRTLLDIDPHTRVVVLTGYGSIATALEAVRLGAVHYLQKPADVDEILAAFHRDELPLSPELSPPATVPSLARAEWEHIQRVLTDCGGNVSQAARLLGLHRRSLQRKLSKYPVSR